MKEQIEGNSYNYIIELEEGENEYCFEIRSLYKGDNSKSVFTNVNFIIGELVEPIINIVPEESTINMTDKKKATLLYYTAIKIFKDRTWINGLEDYLDEDRSCGEWEAEFEFA